MEQWHCGLWSSELRYTCDSGQLLYEGKEHNEYYQTPNEVTAWLLVSLWLNHFALVSEVQNIQIPQLPATTKSLAGVHAEWHTQNSNQNTAAGNYHSDRLCIHIKCNYTTDFKAGCCLSWLYDMWWTKAASREELLLWLYVGRHPFFNLHSLAITFC